MEFPLILIPFALAASVMLLGPRAPRNRLNWLLAAALLALFSWLLSRIFLLATEGPQIVSYPWAPSRGLGFALYLDGLGLLFALLITGIGAASFTLRRLLPGRPRAHAGLRRNPAGVHRQHARGGACRQPAAALRLLKAHQRQLV